jgi:7-cyano-7-deazaguanine synthase
LLENPSAVVLFSGGVDSTTLLAWALSQGYRCYALSFYYNQRHKKELDAARVIAQSLLVEEHRVIHLGISDWGGSALTDPDIVVPKEKVAQPSTYVPARNMIFLSAALGWAEVVGAKTIFFGSNKDDYENYPDCRPAFFSAFSATANVATRGDGYLVKAPFVEFNKSEIIRMGDKLGVDFGLTWSCYNPQGVEPCRLCDACRLRKQSFVEAGVLDPLLGQ